MEHVYCIVARMKECGNMRNTTDKIRFRKDGSRRKSIRYRIIFLISAVILLLLLALFFSSWYSAKVVRQQVVNTNKKLLSLYMNQVDEAFEDVENYWVGLQMSNDFTMSERKDESIAYYTAQQRLKKSMENAIPSYSYMDTLFVYFKDADVYMDAAKYSVSGSVRTAVKNQIREMVSDNVPKEKKGKWFGISVDGEYFLIKFFSLRSAYMGGYVRVTELLEKIRQAGFDKAEYLAFFQNDGRELGDSAPVPDRPLQLKDQGSFRMTAGGGEKYLVLSHPSRRGDYSLVFMAREKQFLGELQSLNALFLWLILGISVFLIFFAAVIKRWLIRPLDELTDAMKKLGEGDLEVRLEQDGDCEEFLAVNKTFDHMIQQIKMLKIDVYEEKMQRQKAELQYLKLQINPHFYINCLNVINSLSMVGRNELIQKMTKYLGIHLRYTMEGNTLDSLRKETEYVENYVKIQELRFGDSICTHFDIQDRALDVRVPPLILQTFIENAVKYQAVPGEPCNIYLKIRYEEENRGIRIEIWDDGDGFAEDVLKCLQDGSRIVDEKGEHYGISNVVQRIGLLYQGNGRITFSNHPETGGAFIVMRLPDL